MGDERRAWWVECKILHKICREWKMKEEMSWSECRWVVGGEYGVCEFLPKFAEWKDVRRWAGVRAGDW